MLHRLVEEQVAARPEHIAILYADRAVSYGELDAEANAVARELLDLGIGHDSVVGVAMKRSPRMVATQLGVLKAGAAFFPLAAPLSRLSHLLEAGLELLIVDEDGAAAAAPVTSRPRMRIEDVRWHRSRPVDDGTLGSHLAYVIATSGTTGRPRGSMIEHRNAAAILPEIARTYAIDSQSRVLQFAKLTFDSAVAEIFGALVSGATLVIPEAAGLASIDRMRTFVTSRRVTVATLPPSLLKTLGSGDLSGLETLISAGEACTQALASRWGRVVPRFINAYGPTECTICATTRRLDSQDTVSIGWPLPGVRIAVVETATGEGRDGEIHIGGAGVGRGYLDDADTTKARFYLDDDGDRWYRTGDRGFLGSSDELFFIGREADQVKVAGVRIDPHEVDFRVQEVDGVVDCAVLAAEKSRRTVLSCFYVAGQHVTQEVLRRYLLRHLPSYMVPTHWRQVPKLPRTPNGKLDKEALGKLDQEVLADRKPEPGPATPEGEVEKAVASVWARLLQVDEVGQSDNWFSLGGDSLLAMAAVSEINQLLGTDVDGLALLEQPDFLEFVAHFLGSAAPEPLPAGLEKSDLPLLGAQQTFWILLQVDPKSKANYVPIKVDIRGTVRPERLEFGLQEAVKRHAALRSVFRSEQDKTIVRIARPSPIALPVLKALDEDVFFAPFDLGAEVFRCRLVRHAPEHWTLWLLSHHIVFDADSERIFLSDLARAYAGQEMPRAVDFQRAVHIEHARALDAEQDSVEFWREHLGGTASPVELPMASPGGDAPGCRTDHFSLDRECFEAVLDLARRTESTRFGVMFGLFTLLMHRVAGQNDVVVGTPVSTRDRAELRGLVGPFINTLAVRSVLADGMSIEEHMRGHRRAFLDCLQHRHLPFYRVVEMLNPARDESANPLFNVMFDWVAASETLNANGLEWKAAVQPNPSAKFDMTLSVSATQASMTVTVEYTVEKIDPQSVRRLVESLTKLIQRAADNLTAGCWQIPALGNRERLKVLESFSRSECELADHAFSALFVQQAAATSDAVVVTCDDRRVSYRELQAWSDRIACRLQAHSAGAESIVAILADRSEMFVAAVVGVWSLRAAYSPIDPSWPRQRAASVLEQLKPVAIVVDDGFAEAVHDLGIPIVNGCADGGGFANGVPVAARPPGELSDLAYVLFTSGSTGVPKGVMIEQLGMVNHLNMMIRALDMTDASVVAQTAPQCFDISVWQMVCALVTGGTVSILSQVDLLNPRSFTARLVDDRITILEVVPSFLSVLLDYLELETETELFLTALLVTGETTHPLLVKRWLERFPSVPVINAYGPAEASDDVTLHWVETPPEPSQATLPIGRPADNIRIYLLDERGNPLPIGAKGELCVAGISVGRGYIGDAARTNEVFVPDPFIDGERMYRTGDLARWQENGVLEFCGRRDSQVKVRGFRIELGEIEHHLKLHASVRDAAVCRSDGAGGALAAFYVSDESVDSADLRAHLSLRVPGYMIPGSFTQLASLPRTRNGKLDVSALPRPATDTGAHPGRPLSSEEERVVARAFEAVLGLSHLGPKSNFFECGGDSLAAIKVVSRVRARSFEISVRDIFRCQTVGELAAGLRVMDAAEPVEVPAHEFPLSPVQAEFLNGCDSGTSCQVLGINGTKVTGDRLERALARLVERHDALRLRFVSDGTQFVGPPYPVPVDVVKADDDVESATDRLAHVLGARLAPGSLLAAGLVVAAERPILVLAVHHLAVDAVSWQTLLDDLDDLLAGRTSGSLESSPYAQWCAALYRFANGPAAEEWFERLNLEVAPPLPRALVPLHNNGTRTFVSRVLSSKQTERLKSVLERHGWAPLAALLLTLLGRATAPSVEISVETHGRSDRLDVDVSRTVGWFTATLPVVLRTDRRIALEIDLHATQVLLAGCVEKAVAFSALSRMREASDAEELRSRPKPILVFNFLGDVAPKGRRRYLGAGHLLSQGSWQDGVPARVEVDARLEEGRLIVEWRWPVECFAAGAIEELLERFDEDLRRSADELVRDLPIEAIFPLTPLQRGLLFESLLNDKAQLYTQQLTLKGRGDLDPVRLAVAWKELQARTPSLRSVLEWTGAQPLQVVLRNNGNTLRWVDLRPLDEGKSVLEELLRRDIERGFDLHSVPPIRAGLAALSDGTWALWLTYHHVVIDGPSIEMVLCDFDRAYWREPPVTRPTFQSYVDWLAAQPRAERMWASHLEGIPPMPRVSTQASLPAVFEHDISEPNSRELDVIAARHHLTLHQLLRALWSIVEGAETGDLQAAVGAVLNGRLPELAGADQIVGMLVNTVPLVTRWQGGESVVVAAARAQADWVELSDLQHVSLGQLKRQLSWPADSDLFETLFTFGGRELLDESDAGKLFGAEWAVASTRELTGYRLSVDVTLRRGCVHLKATCPDFGTEPERAARLLRRYCEAIHRFIERPETPIDEIVVPTEQPPLLPSLPSRSFSPRSPRDESHVPDPNEAVVLEVWRSVFGNVSLSPEDDFFALGGDSILCLRIMAQLMGAGFDVSLSAVYTNSTPRSLARVLRRRVADAPVARTCSDADWAFARSRAGADLVDLLPMTSVHRMVVEHHEKNPDARLFHDQSVITYRGCVVPDRLHTAWQHVVSAHAALRTIFVASRSLQVVLRAQPVEFDVEDLRDLSEPEQARRTAVALNEDLERPFVLDTGSLLRLRLLRTGNDEIRVLMSFHVLVADGWCFAFVLRDVFAAYEALLRGEAPPELSETDLRSYVEWCDNHRAESLQFWRQELEGVKPRLNVPRDKRKLLGVCHPVEIVRRDLSPEDSSRVKEYAAHNGVTLNALLAAAWAQTIRRPSDPPDVVFGATVSGRPPELPDSQETVGLFFNDLPVRVDASGALAQVAQRVQGRLARALPHSSLSLDEIRSTTQSSFDGELFQTVFVFENYPIEAERAVRGRNRTLVEVDAWRREASEIDMTVYVHADEKIEIEIRYLSDVLLATSVEKLIAAYRATLVAALEPRRPDGILLDSVRRGRDLP